jgi:SHS2 domain-containing protein
VTNNGDEINSEMVEYELFDHTADIGVRAKGDDLSTIFKNTALGMYEIIFLNGPPKVSLKGEYQIKLTCSDLEQLLVDWLDELLFIFSTEKIVFSEFEITIDPEGFSLDAKVAGEQIDDSELLATREIKAVTYHMLEIKKNEHWTTQVIFDI